MAQEPPDAPACIAALRTVSETQKPGASAADLRRMVGCCFRVMGIGPEPAFSVEHFASQRSLEWAAQTCFDALIIDKQGRNRDYVQSGITRRLALGRAAEKWDHDAPLPLPHIPMDADDAEMLIAPYLADLAGRLDDDPLAHIALCWDVFEFPAPPFDGIFDRWLAQLDTARGTDDLGAIRRAMALAQLAEEGRQRLSWHNCQTELLPQLSDPHPLVAGAAGRYLGLLYSDPEEMFVFSTPQPLQEMLNQLAALPINRRLAAGGFLQGFDVGMEGPFHTLHKDLALDGFDLDGWTLEILAQTGVEPYLPSAQAFWFYVHEGYCFDPSFITRMIDAGHLWEAMMTATEVHQPVEGMKPVLQRLVALNVEDVSEQAQRWLDLHYVGLETV